MDALTDLEMEDAAEDEIAPLDTYGESDLEIADDILLGDAPWLTSGDADAKILLDISRAILDDTPGASFLTIRDTLAKDAG